MEPWINETVFIIVKKHKVIHTGDEDIKDDRDPTKTDSTDLDSNTWGNKLNYEAHLDDMNTIRQGKKLSHGAHGEEKHNKHSPGAWHYSPLPEGASRAITIPPGSGQTETREAMKEGGAREEPEQEEPGRTQATAITAAHGGVDGGRSHGEGMAADSRGPTNGSGAGGGGARGGDGEMKSKGDREDPGDRGEADSAGDHGIVFFCILLHMNVQTHIKLCQNLGEYPWELSQTAPIY